MSCFPAHQVKHLVVELDDQDLAAIVIKDCILKAGTHIVITLVDIEIGQRIKRQKVGHSLCKDLFDCI